MTPGKLRAASTIWCETIAPETRRLAIPRISGRKVVVVFLAATVAVLVSCASPKPPAHVQESPANPCRKYESPTEFGRCHLFMTADGRRFIPEIGRNADLDTQIRCAPVRPDLDVYAECIHRTRVVATARPAAPAAGPASRGPIRVEPITPDVAVAAPSPEPSTWTVTPEAEAQLTPRDQSLSIEPRQPSAEIAKSPLVRLRQPAVTPVSDDAIRQRFVQQSVAQYSGSCPCPYNVDRGGRRCGGRSAYSRPGGESPYCYASDVPVSTIEAYRQRSVTRLQ
jgi:hypothetical protein